MKLRPSFIAFAAALWLLTGSSKAAIHLEIGDAGELPGSAQSTMGAGSLDSIQGNLILKLNGNRDIDMYAINIVDPVNFSATTVSLLTTVLDTQLFLFTSSGIGVVANDDTIEFVEFRSTIPPGNVPGPAGLYYLAIAGFPDRPISISGRIFPDPANSDAIVTNTGLGGADPIIDWDRPLGGDLGGHYEIILDGAEAVLPQQIIPEPSSLALMSGLFGLAALRFRIVRRRLS
jgi:hypothetical protein